MARADALEEVESDDEIMLLGGAQADASWDLLNTAAPDIAALAHKLTVFRDEEAYHLCAVVEVLDGLIADARRLAQEASGGQ